MMIKITVPPKPAEPVVIGEIDLEVMAKCKENVVLRVQSKSNRDWHAWVVEHKGGSLVYIPSVLPSQL